LYFAGSSNYLTYASNAAFGYGTGNFTEEVWIYPTASNWTSGNFYISDHGGNLLQLQYYLGALNWNSGAIVGSTAILANTWSHIAVSRSSGTLKIFIDGVSGFSGSVTTNLDKNAGGKIGSDVAGDAVLNGYIDDLRITKGYARYTTTFTPPTAAFPNTGPY